ncbi:MAG: hypothetical protein LC808_01485, partial [Actinobacteria bacterium]|nr:hypothetical protein [Actinomycetota bacterium]
AIPGQFRLVPHYPGSCRTHLVRVCRSPGHIPLIPKGPLSSRRAPTSRNGILYRDTGRFFQALVPDERLHEGFLTTTP